MTDGPKVLHIVLFRTLATVTQKRIDEVRNLFHATLGEIAGLERVIDGPNISPRKSARGWNLAVLMLFSSLKTRDQFLPHPAHLRIGQETSVDFYEQLAVYDIEVKPDLFS